MEMVGAMIEANPRDVRIVVLAYGAWTVVFNGTGTAPEHVLNLNSGSQLRWNGSDWIMAIDGEYAPGMWRLWL